jgi:hypothetical protein
MSLLEDIRSFEATPVTFEQIMSAIGPLKNECHLLFLDGLPNKITESDIFKGKRFALVLWTLHKPGTSGIRHWTVLYKQNGIKFFDSLGNGILQLFKITHEPHRGFYNWCSRQKIESSTYKLQKSAHTINTCGYHCSVRIIESQKSHREYARWLKQSGMSPDMAVSWLCYLAFHK